MQELFHRYQKRLNRADALKIPDFEEHGRLKHVIQADQFDRQLLDDLMETADLIRQLHRVHNGNRFLKDLLVEQRVMLYFTQASTRTFLSFMAACQMLGMSCNEIRDPVLSSEYKGESSFDSVRMFSGYFDMVIMRAVVPNLAECCAYMMNDLQSANQRNIPIINGGSGADEHPTQALLDIYTMQRAFSFDRIDDSSSGTYYDALREQYPDLKRGIDHKTVCFCGDLGRSRTVRSVVKLLLKYDDVRFIFIAPDHKSLRIGDDVKDMLRQHGADFHEAQSLDEVMEEVDLVYMTRIQHEHDNEVVKDFFDKTDFSPFKLTLERVQRMKRYAPILHPFPRLDEIPFEVDMDERALYFEQAINGMWIRAALIAHIFNVERKILSFYKKNFSGRHHYNEEVL